MFVAKRRNADFGTLGADNPLADIKDVANTAKEVKGTANEVGGGGGCMDGLCGCANKSAAAKNAKQAEVNKANPVPVGSDGKEIPRDSPDCKADCQLAYKKRDEQMAAWQKNEDLKASLQLPQNVKGAFAFAAELGTELKKVLPASAGSMTLAEIYKKYPAQSDAVYKKVIAKYPDLAGVPLGTLIAGAPSIASMKLDDAIARASVLGGAPPAANTLVNAIEKVPGGAYGAAGLVALIAGAAYFAFKKPKK